MTEAKDQNYQSLDHLLADNKRKDGQPYTHTRIGNYDMGIPGGSYTIPDNLMPQFYKLYHKKVFIQNKKEYLTEAQDKEKGNALLVDIDMRFPVDTTERQYSISEISDIIQLYGESMQELLIFDEQMKIPVYIFEKNNVVVNNEKKITKDGLHFVFGIHMLHALQLILRDIVIQKEPDMEIFENLGCTNSLEDIFDECISTGKNNWQVWGSRKPGFEAYKLTQKWDITIDNDTFECEPDSDFKSEDKKTIKTLLPIVSARNKNFQKAPTIKDKYKTIFNSKMMEKKKKKKKVVVKNSLSTFKNIKNIDKNINLVLPNTQEKLDEIIQSIHSSLDIKDYHLKELHEFVMLLDERYYDPFPKWIEVGWALHNTSDYMFWTWVKFSSKSEKFIWCNIPDMIHRWNTEMKQDGKTWRSIYHWVRTDFPEKYQEIRKKNIDTFLWASLTTQGADTDIAILSKHLYKGEFAFTSFQPKQWFRFNNHRWKENDGGVTLRQRLSAELNKLFVYATRVEKDKAVDDQYTADEREGYLKNAHVFNKIAQNLKTASKKKQIMEECAEQFYDKNLKPNLDERKHLLGFKNGIYDLDKHEFRNGEPEDYISFSTRNDFVAFDENNKEHIEIKNEINDFMTQIFPDPEVKRYMWEHAASILYGVNINQKFTIYTGCGSNGKSVWVDLINGVLGEYADKLDIALMTQKRGKAGGPSPEITKLKGKRFVSMDEPSAGDQLNEGIMKQYTGGDEITGREMYGRRPIKFKPQFELICCTNRLFEINSTDKGTWRRIRQVDFKAEFVDEEVYKVKEELGLCNDSNNPIYKKLDPSVMKDKLNRWIPIFTQLLILKFKETKGRVKDCKAVLQASNTYREKQDFYEQFSKEKLVRGTNDDKIKKTDIRTIFAEWYTENMQKRPPKAQDLYDFLDKRLGKYRKRGWWGWKIKYESTLSEDEEDDESMSD